MSEVSSDERILFQRISGGVHITQLSFLLKDKISVVTVAFVGWVEYLLPLDHSLALKAPFLAAPRLEDHYCPSLSISISRLSFWRGFLSVASEER